MEATRWSLEATRWSLEASILSLEATRWPLEDHNSLHIFFLVLVTSSKITVSNHSFKTIIASNGLNKFLSVVIWIQTVAYVISRRQKVY